MPATFTLSRAALASLFESLYPNPDDPGDPGNPWGPYGPIGPVAHRFDRLSAVALNPQPLPPKEGPHPDPWRGGRLARAVVDDAVRIARAARLDSAGADPRAFVAEVVDDWCGTPPHRWPLPWPHALDDPLAAPALLGAARQFHRAAEATGDEALRESFGAAADRLFGAAVERLEPRG